MKKKIAFAFVFIFLSVYLCGCGANSVGLPRGGSVFPKGEVERAVLHCIPDSQVEVPAEHLQAITDWAQNFEYDKAIGSDLLEPGTNTFSVTLFYADGSSHTSGIDIGCIGEKNYYIKREKPPVCWDVLYCYECGRFNDEVNDANHRIYEIQHKAIKAMAETYLG